MFFKDVKTAVRLNTEDGVIDDAIALPGLFFFAFLQNSSNSFFFQLIYYVLFHKFETFRLYLPPPAFYSSRKTWNNVESIETIRLWQWTRTCSWLYTAFVCCFKPLLLRKSILIGYVLFHQYCCNVFRLKVPKGGSTELTEEGFQFITSLFQKFDEVFCSS